MYKKPNDFVYVHYNPRHRCIQEEVELKYGDLLCSNFVYDKEDLMIGWFDGPLQQSELDKLDHLLD